MHHRATAARPGIHIALLAAALSTAVLAACGGDGFGPGSGGITEPCTSYSLTVTAGSLLLNVGDQTTLTAKVGTCTSRKVLWAVTDSSVLGVTAKNDTSAIVTARGKGVAAVLARLLADSIATQHQTVIQVE